MFLKITDDPNFPHYDPFSVSACSFFYTLALAQQDAWRAPTPKPRAPPLLCRPSLTPEHSFIPQQFSCCPGKPWGSPGLFLPSPWPRLSFPHIFITSLHSLQCKLKENGHCSSHSYIPRFKDHTWHTYEAFIIFFLNEVLGSRLEYINMVSN